MLSNIFASPASTSRCIWTTAVLIFYYHLEILKKRCLLQTLYFYKVTVYKETTMETPKVYKDIDWNLLWQNAREQKAWTGKTAADWDKKAPSFAERNKESPYVSLFLSRLPLDTSLSVLDVGSGPGTLAVPMAPSVQSVTALDYSQGMLDILKKQIQQEKLNNIFPVLGSWEDDWKELGLTQYDITIASRSMGVANLTEAITKLNEHASKYVFITDRITPTPFDPMAFGAIGRSFDSGPDYIYTVNTLYTMGIYAHISILQLEQDMVYQNIDEALNSYSWMFQDLTQKEEEDLISYLRSRIIDSTGGNLVIRRPYPPKWALIWWEKGKII